MAGGLEAGKLLPKELISEEHLPHPEIRLLTETAAIAALDSAKIVKKVFNGIPLSELHVEFKDDATPRTVADIEGDIAIVNAIHGQRPQDHILIEESGYHEGNVDLDGHGQESLIWLADSLDGTRPFIEGKPESTVGVGVFDRDMEYLAVAIVHPFRKQLTIAVRGMGAYLIPLSDDLEVIPGKAEKLEVSSKTTLEGGTVCIDSLFTEKNREIKHSFMRDLEERTKNLSYDMTGSNIAYEAEVAKGTAILGLTDAKGGDWDILIGEGAIIEAGGIMIDPLTGQRPSHETEVVIYGNEVIVRQVLPLARQTYGYNLYRGFR